MLCYFEFDCYFHIVEYSIFYYLWADFCIDCIYNNILCLLCWLISTTSYSYYAAYSFYHALLLATYHIFHNKANHMLNKWLISLPLIEIKSCSCILISFLNSLMVLSHSTSFIWTMLYTIERWNYKTLKINLSCSLNIIGVLSYLNSIMPISGLS